MRIHYEGNREHTGETRIRTQNRRVNVHSSASGGQSFHIRMPAENLSDPRRIARECPVCQMNGVAVPEAAPGLPMQVVRTEDDFCVFRLPKEEAKRLAELLWAAVGEGEVPPSEEPREL